jgi:hypothetical protein
MVKNFLVVVMMEVVRGPKAVTVRNMKFCKEHTQCMKSHTHTYTRRAPALSLPPSLSLPLTPTQHWLTHSGATGSPPPPPPPTHTHTQHWLTYLTNGTGYTEDSYVQQYCRMSLNEFRHSRQFPSDNHTHRQVHSSKNIDSIHHVVC